MKPILLMLLALVFMLIVVGQLRKKKQERDSMLQRMEYFSGNEDVAVGGGKKKKKKDITDIRELLLSKVRAIAAKWRKIHQSVNLDTKMQQADWPITGSEFQVIAAVISVVAAIIAFLMTLVPLNAIIAFGGMMFLCFMYLNIYISRRQAAFVNQLGSTLLMVSNALRAGFSFMQAMELISNEMDAPIGAEFRKVVNEINLGSTVETALEGMGQRMKSPDFDLVVTAVLIQRQVGGNLSQVLDSISNTINERIRMKNEISSLTAQGRLSGLIVGGIPIFIVFMVLSSDPNYFDPMLESSTGKFLLGAAVALEVLAVIVIRKVVNIDV